MKHLLTVMLLSWLSLTAWAQECMIPLGVYVASRNLPEASAEVLQHRLTRVVTANGIEGRLYSRFALVADVSEVQEEVIPGVRSQYLKVISLDLSVRSAESDEKFGVTSIRLKGAGTTAERAFNAAFAQLDTNNQIAGFLEKAKGSIVAYYNSQLDHILARCNTYCAKDQYEEALCLLSSVPSCCGNYARVQGQLEATYQKYVEYDCAEKILRARAIWAASQTKEAALAAGAYLSAVSPSAACSAEAVQLMSQIQNRMGDEWELEKELLRGGMALESERIQAARAIGVAYGEHQKAQTYNDHWIIR